MSPDFRLLDEFRPGPSTVRVAFYVGDSVSSKEFDVPAIDVGDGFRIYLTSGQPMVIPKVHRRPCGD